MTKWQADCGYGSCRADIGGELFAGGSLASRLLTTFDEYGSWGSEQQSAQSDLINTLFLLLR